MKKNYSLIILTAVICAFSAVSCGNDKTEESSVSLDLPVVTTEAKETESAESEAAEENTSETETVTTDVSTSKEEKTSETSATAETTEKNETVTEKVTESAAEPEVTDEPAAEPQPDNVTEPPVIDVDEPQQAEPPADVPADPPAPQSVQFSMDNLNSDASGIISALGNALDVQSATGCLSNGADQKIYTYDGLILSCYVIDGAEYIYSIEITSGSYSTSAGITVGNSRADVEAVYGAGEESGNYVIYYDGSKELDIEYNGDTVSSVIFYTMV